VDIKLFSRNNHYEKLNHEMPFLKNSQFTSGYQAYLIHLLCHENGVDVGNINNFILCIPFIFEYLTCQETGTGPDI
jgi:hypothetical protein